MTTNPQILRRYTDLPALLYLLNRKVFTLLDPRSWDDSNDSYYLALYKQKRKLKSLLALCFTQAGESYHHWRVFAPGSGGVCVQFKRPEFLQAVVRHASLHRRAVRYLKLTQIKSAPLAVTDLPFVKRFAFEHEQEYRIIYESRTIENTTVDFPLPLSCISRITLSPWIHQALYEQVKNMLKSLDGCDGLDVSRSTLISNDQWKRLGDEASHSLRPKQLRPNTALAAVGRERSN